MRGEIALFVGALLVRLAYLAEMHGSPFFSVLVGDEQYYNAWARRVASGDWIGSRALYHAPLYPFGLGAHYALGGTLLSARVLQALIGALASVFLARAGRHYFSSRVGWIAGWLLALYAPAIYFTGTLLKTTLALSLVCVFIASWGAWTARRSMPFLFASGLALGLLGLTRENTLLLWPVLLAGLALGRASGATRVARMALLTIGFALPIFLTAWHNLRAEGAFRFGTTNMGPNLYIGNHPGADGLYQALRPGRGGARYERDDAVEMAELARAERLSSWAVSDYWRERALQWMRSQPSAWAALFLRKLHYCFSYREWMDSQSYSVVSSESLVLRAFSRMHNYGAWVALAAAGVVFAWRERRRLLVLYVAAALWILSVAAFFVFARFRAVWLPILALLAARALAGFWDARRSPKAALAPLTALAAFGGLAFAPIAVEEHPLSTTWGNVAAALRREGRYDEARAAFERAFAARPRDPILLFNSGLLDIATGDMDSARRAFEQAVRLEASFRADCQLALGVAYAQAGEGEAALEAMLAARESAPRSAEVHARLGLILRQQARPREAEQAYRTALQLRPHDLDTLNNLGFLLRLEGRWAEAVRAWERALAIDPTATRTLINLARLRLAAPDDALRDLALGRELSGRIAAQLGDDHVEVLDLRAAAAAEAGDFGRARALAQRAAQAARETSQADRIRTRARLYAAGEPWRLEIR